MPHGDGTGPIGWGARDGRGRRLVVARVQTRRVLVGRLVERKEVVSIGGDSYV